MGVDQVSVIASALKHMLAAGMPHDAIVSAIAEMEANIARDPVAEKRRAYDRIRRREERAAAKADMSTGHRRTSSESADTADNADIAPSPAPSPLLPPDPQQPPAPTHTPEGDAGTHEGLPVSVRIAWAIATCQAIRRIKPPFALPAHIPAQPWADFVAMRQRIRKPMTDRAKELAVLELDKLAAAGWPPGDVLNNSTMNSYQGLVPPKGRNNGQHHQNRTPEHDIRDPLARAVVARQAERARRTGPEPF